MTLMDDLHRAVSVPEGEAQILAMRSAFWIYERNPGLSLDEQAEGFAFLIATCLHIADAGVRQTCLPILKELSMSRSHTIGSQVDWDAFIQALPTLGKQQALHTALVLLCDANDARYLSALEHYFDHPDHHDQALSSWVALAFTERYTLDERVRPFLHEAEEQINNQFAPAQTRALAEKKKRTRAMKIDPHAAEHHWTPLFPEARAWAIQQFAQADERIQQQFQVRDCRALQREDEEHRLGRIVPGTLSASVQQDLAVPLSAEEYEHKMIQLLDTFTYNASFPIDDVALTVRIMVDSAWQSESEGHRWTWAAIATAFQTRRYAGTYLDWNQLVAMLPSFDDDRNDPQFGTLRSVLSCLSKAPDERFLALLQSYLDHPHHYVRADAADGISLLLRHLAHYRPEAIFLARQIMEGISSDSPKTPEAWQSFKERLARLTHEARPYFHYYSI